MIDYFIFYDDQEICDKVYNYIFTLCDRVEFLNSNSKFVLESLDNVFFNSHKYNLRKSLLDIKFGVDYWNMNGNICNFKLSNDLKFLITQVGFENFYKIEYDNRSVFLENLTLYKSNKLMFSICTHEGYTKKDDDFNKKVSNYIKKELLRTKMFCKMKNTYLNLSKNYTNVEIIEIYQKLRDIEAYVAKDSNANIRMSSEYENITFEEYKILAQKVFSESILSKLNVSSFKELNNKNNLTEFSLNQNDNIKYSQFLSTQLYKDMTRELSFLYLFLDYDN